MLCLGKHRAAAAHTHTWNLALTCARRARFAVELCFNIHEFKRLPYGKSFFAKRIDCRMSLVLGVGETLLGL